MTATVLRPSRVIVLGHSGFIGQRLIAHLRATTPELPVVGCSRPDLDLSITAEAERLASLFDAGSVVVFLAAVKRQSGDTVHSFMHNSAIIETVVTALARQPAARLIYFSSAAIYGEDVAHPIINEATPLQPRSYYGLSKFTGEWVLRRHCPEGGPTSLLCVRPATIYGPTEPGLPYGPTGFLRQALANRPIVLWGDGSELREFLYVEDVVELLGRLIQEPVAGVLNLASGTSWRFTDVLDAVATTIGQPPMVDSRQRSKDKVDNRFDASRLRGLFPDFRFTSLSDGIARTCRDLLPLAAPLA
jgi:UDP-glucose 4-epimerase